MKKRKICIVTGTRADYGWLKPIMIAIKKHPRLDLQLLVTGMHLLSEHGSTMKEIEKDGFHVNAKVNMAVSGDSGAAMAESVGEGIQRITKAFEKLRPDIVLVLGDRIEALAATISAAFMNIPVAHMGGGQITGSIDESIRHAITKFAHIHFPRLELHKKRIIRLGEAPWRVYIVGAACVDAIKTTNLINPKKIAKKYNLNLKKPILLVIQHPITTEIDKTEYQIKQTMEALVNLKEQVVIIHPNADAGGKKIIKTFQKYKKYRCLHFFKNIPQNEYFSLMNIAALMLGNSSSAFTEAPLFHLPSINIGSRQVGRERLGNIVDVDYKKNEIIKTVKRIINDKLFRNKLKNCEATKGNAKTGEKIAKILSDIDLSPDLIKKRFFEQ